MKHIVVRLLAIFVTLATCGAVATAQQPTKDPADRLSGCLHAFRWRLPP